MNKLKSQNPDSRLISIADLPQRLTKLYSTNHDDLQERNWAKYVVDAVRKNTLPFRDQIGLPLVYGDNEVAIGYTDVESVGKWLSALGLDADVWQREPAPVGAEGITKPQVLIAFQELVRPFDLKKALGNGKGLFGEGGARTQKGTPGGKHIALWNPIVLALGLHDKHSVPMPHLKKAFDDHSFLRKWSEKWRDALDLLGE
jgi:hypothetical protein